MEAVAPPVASSVAIAPGELDSVLEAVRKQTGLQIVYVTAVTKGKRSGGAPAGLPVEQTLTRVLEGTGLRFQWLDRKTVQVSAAEVENAGTASAEGEKGALTLAQSESARAGEQTIKQKDGVQLEEIVVTAQKRVERLQDVPVPVTTIDAQSLVSSNQLRMEDYYNRIPGLTLTVGDGRGMPMLSIRGITSGYTNPTVGVVIDDMPYGSSTNSALGAMLPDIDPSELARIEVLRGPQGTLYGASSMGGLFKYVTLDPSTDGVMGRMQAGVNSVRNGDELGYNVSGSINVPLGDTFAVRAHGFSRRDAGYIDDPTRGVEGINNANFEGGRIAALWRPLENVSLKLSGLLQESENNGLSRFDVQPGFAEFEQTAFRGTGRLDKRITAYAANLTAQLGPVDLTAISGYNVNRFRDVIDVTPLLGPASEEVFGVRGSPLFDFIETTKITEEVRFSLPLGQRVEWLLGGFYTDEDSELKQQILAQDDDGTTKGSWLDGDSPSTFKEFALFTNFTFHVTDRLDVQVGGRESRLKQTTSGILTGPLAGGVSIATPTNTKDNAFTYLLTPRFKISPDLMVYARLASGYRAGVPNSNLVAGVPRASGPDKTKNYELGVKGNAFHDLLSVDASLYRIDWVGIQMQVTNGLVGYFTNGSDAKSEGVELSVESLPAQGLRIAGWITWGEASLSEEFPEGSNQYGVSGDRLPYSTRLSGHLSVEKEFPLTSLMTGFVGGAVSYVGDRVGYFTASPVRQRLPSYAKTDLRAGVKYDSWTLDAFLNNATDRRGQLTGGLDSTPAFGFTYIQPRTIGLTLGKTF